MPNDVAPLEPPTPTARTSHRAQTRSHIREEKARNSALLLTPPRATNRYSYPLTPPLTTYRSHKHPRHEHEQLDSEDLPPRFTPSAKPTGEVGAGFVARLKALREYLEAGVLPEMPHAIEDTFKISTYIASNDPWAESLSRLETICGNVKARGKQLDELTLKEQRLIEKDALLFKIVKVHNEAMTCPITGRLTQSMYILSPCGHACSEEGLHDRFQTAVKHQFTILRFLYRHIRDEDVPTGFICRDFLLKLRARSVTFRPRFECYCGAHIVRPPVKCWAFAELATKLQKLTKRDDSVPKSHLRFPCDISDYFIFYGHVITA